MPKRPNDCQARQYSDQMICHTCGLAWDMNDPDPPECRRSKAVSINKAKLLSSFEAEAPKTSNSMPVTLPANIATEMDKAYLSNEGGTRGMQAAYRVFLDMLI